MELLNKSDPRFNKLYEVNFLDAFKNQHSIEIKAIFEYKKNELENFKGGTLYYNKAQNLDFLNTNSEYRMITCIPDPTDKLKWFYVNQLHIHHTYYEPNKMPWEYPITSLQTLCWVCHKDVHNN